MPIKIYTFIDKKREVFKKNLEGFFVESKCEYVCIDLKNCISNFLPRGNSHFHSNFHINNNIDKFVKYCKSKNIKLLIFINLPTTNWKKRHEDDMLNKRGGIIYNATNILKETFIASIKSYFKSDDISSEYYNYHNECFYYCKSHDIIISIAFKIEELNGNCMILSNNQKFFYIDFKCWIKNISIFSSWTWDNKSLVFIKKCYSYKPNYELINVPGNVSFDKETFPTDEIHYLQTCVSVASIINPLEELGKIRILFYYYLKKKKGYLNFSEKIPKFKDGCVYWEDKDIGIELIPSDVNKLEFEYFKSNIKEYIEEKVFYNGKFIGDYTKFNIKDKVTKKVYSNFVFWFHCNIYRIWANITGESFIKTLKKNYYTISECCICNKEILVDKVQRASLDEKGWKMPKKHAWCK